jgi:hypothetical protein
MGPTSIRLSYVNKLRRAVQPASGGAIHNPQQELQKIDGFKAGNVFFK